MARILSALLILLLAVSHAPMSAAMPHYDGTTHEHALVADHHDDDHGTELAADPAAQPDSTAPEGDLGKATHGTGHHSHVTTDGVPTADMTFLDRRFKKDRQRPVDDARLRSAALEPLPEPPSA